MKRYLFLFMACLVFLLAACGNNDSKDSKDSSDSKEVTYTDQDGKAPNNAFTKSNVWKNTDAIKNDHVIYYSINEFLYSDPISLEKQSDFFKKELLNK